MTHRIKLLAIFTTGLLALGGAQADPIIEVYSGGTAADPLGGYDMTAFGEPAPSEVPVTSAASPLHGDVLFMRQGGTTPLPMTVEDPDWWQWDHGRVYTTDVLWIELIMPTNTRAFSFFVGSSFRGTGWVEAYDSNGGTTLQTFNLSSGTTPGFGVYSSDSCSAITKVIIEPRHWGFGNMAINQDPCVQVPEPAPITLLGLGLLGIALARRFRTSVVAG